jgi:hypothetical protein
MLRDPTALARTLERKQGFVLAADDASFVAEVRGFLQWALGDLGVREHLLGLLEPPDEVARYVDAAPGLVADAGDVVNWMRAKEPQACAEVADASAWDECDRLVAMAREGSAPEVADRAAYVFGMLNAARDGVGRAFRDRTDNESVAAWQAALDLARTFEHRVRERNLAVRVAPGGALLQLVALCRGADVPEGTKHWSDFTEGAVGFGVAPIEDVASARAAFRRVIEGLLTSLEGSSRSRTTLRGYVERTRSFDVDRVTRLATSGGEPALTRELLLYLHDAGLPVATKRAPHRAFREPAIGARAVVSSNGDAEKVLEGLRTLHADLLALDAAGFEVDEGLMAVFVVAGPLFDIPPDMKTARFTIRIESIDLRPANVPHGDPVRISGEVALAATV